MYFVFTTPLVDIYALVGDTPREIFQIKIPDVGIDSVVLESMNMYVPWYEKYGEVYIILGHSYIFQGEGAFSNLDDVRIGSRVYVSNGQENIEVELEVIDIKILKENQDIQITDEYEYIIYTCYPKYISTHRLVVYLREVRSGKLFDIL